MATNPFTTHDGAFSIDGNTYNLYQVLRIWTETAQAAKDAATLIAALNTQQEEDVNGPNPFTTYRLRPSHDLAAIRKYLTERGFKEVIEPAETE